MTHDPGNQGEHPQPAGGQSWPGQSWPGAQPPPHSGAYAPQPPPTPPGWGPPPEYEGPSGFGPGGGPRQQAKGFFGALFDFEFTTFATPIVVKIVYIVGMVLLGLVYVFVVIAGFAQHSALGLLLLIVGAIMGLFYLTLFRIVLEFYYAVVRMSEDIHNRR